MISHALKSPVSNRGPIPDSFLFELIAWAKTAPDEIFAPNDKLDIYTIIKPFVATPAGTDPAGTPIYRWDSLLHRRAALLEAMRVHAGLESSWKFGEGVDRTNARSQANPRSQETGVFQVSFDSLGLGGGALLPFARERGIHTVEKFIHAMKEDHPLALEYYARLVRVSIRWAGPLIRNSGEDRVTKWLRRAAVDAFQAALA